MISCIDDNLGVLFDKLDSLNIAENTLVILINDNGATFGTDIWNANMRGVKTTAWYGGTRAISFWRWLGTLKPHDVQPLTAHVDILPTLAELAGAGIPDETMQKLDGRSLVPLLESPDADWPDRALFTHVGRWNNGAIDAHKYCQCNVRYGKYAMVRIEYCDDPDCHAECRIIRRVQNGGEGYYSKKYATFHYAVTPKGKWALYDIHSDLPQEHNIAEEHPEIIKKLSDQYEQWWKEVYPHVK
jgi:arylsulfatase